MPVLTQSTDEPAALPMEGTAWRANGKGLTFTDGQMLAKQNRKRLSASALMSLFPAAAVLSATRYGHDWNTASMCAASLTIIYGVLIVFLAVPRKPMYLFGIIAALTGFVGAIIG